MEHHERNTIQCGGCDEDLVTSADVEAEREYKDCLCIPCRKRKADKAKEDRIADFCEGCGPAMNAILDVIFPLVEHWEVDDLNGDEPCNLRFSNEDFALNFDSASNHATVIQLHDFWTLSFHETTPPFIVYMAIKAAVDAEKK